jgi:tetratricopeptide (TPR) repeat protein
MGMGTSVEDAAPAMAYASSGTSLSEDAAPLPQSGPLPRLQGFEELQGWVSSNPEDMGAAIALASAYAQAGHTAYALRMYRRILKKRSVSPAILTMIGDELDEMEGELAGQPRYHQTRGDLLMKQGRFKEAIEEFNKI